MGERKADRRRSNTLDIADRLGGSHGNLARTRSLSSLGGGGGPGGDAIPPVDPSNLMATVFWIAASLLESDYEFEYLLALRLLNKLLGQLPLDRADSRERLERVQAKLKWYSFPGLLQLFLKGFTSASTQELTIHLLSKLISVSRHTLVDPSQVAGECIGLTACPHRRSFSLSFFLSVSFTSDRTDHFYFIQYSFLRRLRSLALYTCNLDLKHNFRLL